MLVLLAIIMLSASWMLVSRLNTSTAGIIAARRDKNSVVLAQAKQALIGWIALQALKAGEPDPGRLPCPEPASVAGTDTEGGTTAYCSTSPAIGRYPWRTVGTDKLVDASGEPLWLVISSGWKKPNSTTSLSINSNTAGSLTVDGQANAAIALIIAPGPAMNSQAATGCTARNQVQTRAAPSSSINPLDYIECYDAATSTFTSAGASTSINDQMVVITAADVMPVLEAAIASRITREVAPVLKSVYASVPVWSLSAATPLFPYAAPFANPSTSTFEGTVGTREGLLPMSRATACSGAITTGCPPVNVALISWGSASASKTAGTVGLNSSNCTLVPAGAPTSISCSLNTANTSFGTLTVKIQATIDPFLALRVVDATVAQNAPTLAGTGSTGFSSSCTGAWTLAAGGATLSCTGDISVGGLLCGVLWFLCTKTFTVTAPIPLSSNLLTADHALTDPNDATTGWFVRNRWHELVYYATTSNHLSGGTRTCTGATCLTVTNLSPSGENRALLILAGRILSAQTAAGGTRPSGTLSHYLEDPINTNGDMTYVAATSNASVNDRFIVVDKN